MEFTNHVVVGTAGHIDHGKTALVKALTGRDLDTQNEEIRRGITISPGFTWLELPDVRVGLIDVPGHERFIKNMIAGAAGIDIAMLVVAANEGVKPQTLEHLDILGTLGLSGGLVVLTKCGLADELMIELAEDDIMGKLRGTFLENAETVRVDSLTGLGIAELRAKLSNLVSHAKLRDTAAPARLNIDRVFTKKGFGAVVTGTLAEGKLSQGDELTLYPEGTAVKIRGIQVHEAAAHNAQAGQRCALNLSGVKTADIARGDVLAEPGSMSPTRFLDVKLRLFGHANRTVKFWDRLRLYVGARELFCRAVPLSGNEILPGGEDFCQLRLEEELYCKKDDRFVIRYYSPMETIGGGVVVDARPSKHARMDQALQEALLAKEAGSGCDVAEDFVREYPGSRLRDLRDHAALSEDAARALLDELELEHVIMNINNLYFHRDLIDKVRERALSLLSDYHAANPLRKGMPKEALKSRLTSPPGPREQEVLLSIMESEGLIKTAGGGILALRAFEVQLTAKQREAWVEMERMFIDGGFTPPALNDLTRNDRKRAEVLELMAPDKVIFLDKSTVMHVQYYYKAKESAEDYLHSHGEITLAAFRDLIGTSRKYAQLLLERFDDERITVRVGDVRRLVKR